MLNMLMPTGDSNPFRFTGPISPSEMIDREDETASLLANASGGHLSRLEAPRRYGKTSLLGRTGAEAAAAGTAVAVVDFEDVLSLGAVVARIERAYSRSLKGSLRRWVDRHLSSLELGLSLGPVGFGMTLKTNPAIDPEPVLLRLLELPEEIFAKRGVRSLIVFDEVQGLLRVDGAPGIVRSVIQHHPDAASYVFAGSAATLMRKLFDEPSAPFLSQGVVVGLPPLSAEDVSLELERRFGRSGRDPGDALSELVRFARGHPQRVMLLAHHLWRLTRDGVPASVDEWLDARDAALESSEQALRASLGSLPLNEQRAAQALATAPGSPSSQGTLRLVGLSRNSAYSALEALKDRGEAIETPNGLRLADPLLEYWLREKKEM